VELSTLPEDPWWDDPCLENGKEDGKARRIQMVVGSERTVKRRSRNEERDTKMKMLS